MEFVILLAIIAYYLNLAFCLYSNHRMEKPEYCPKAMYDMMLKAWDADPTKRPNFLELMDELGDLLEDGEKDHYLNLTKNFDLASTVGNFVNAVENRDYFGMMAAPDFMSQMSVTPAQVSPEDGYSREGRTGCGRRIKSRRRSRLLYALFLDKSQN